MNGSAGRLIDQLRDFGSLYTQAARSAQADPDRQKLLDIYTAGLMGSIDGLDASLGDVVASLDDGQQQDFDRLTEMSGGAAMLESLNMALRSGQISDPDALIDASGIIEKIKRILREIFTCFGQSGGPSEPTLESMDRFKENINSQMPFDGAGRDCIVQYYYEEAATVPPISGRGQIIFIFGSGSSRQRIKIDGRFDGNGIFRPSSQIVLFRSEIPGRCNKEVSISFQLMAVVRAESGDILRGGDLVNLTPRPTCLDRPGDFNTRQIRLPLNPGRSALLVRYSFETFCEDLDQ